MRHRIISAGVVAASATMLVLAAPASAHITVSAPGAVRGGSDTTITFRVPDESDSASTVGLKIQIPTQTPIAGVLVLAAPGWTHTQKTVHLVQPVNTDVGPIDEAVSEVDWTAGIRAGIRPGEFGEFTIQAGLLPDATQLTFKAVQTYSDGTQVAWIEVPSPGSKVEPEHPAPMLSLTPAASARSSDGSDTTAVVLAGIGFAVAAAAVAVGVTAVIVSRRRAAAR